MPRKLLPILALVSVHMMIGSAALGQVGQSLYLGAGKPGSQSFELGVGVTSLIKVRLLPSDGIDLTLVETADRDVHGDLLITDQKKFAALKGWEPITRSAKSDLRSVMTFKRSAFGDGPSLELVARADVPDDAIYLVTKAILENGVFLEDLNKRSWDLTADQALIGLNLPIHPGAIRYYQEIGEANLSVNTVESVEPAAGGPAEPLQESSFFLDFDAGTMALDPEAKKRIAEVCQYATVLDAPEIKVASYIDKSTNPARHGIKLSRVRVRYVVAALRSNSGCADSLAIVPIEKPAPSTPVQMADGKDGRVEIIIMLTD